MSPEMGVARQTAHRWWRRFVAEGESGLQDRSCVHDAALGGHRVRWSGASSVSAGARSSVRIGYRLGLAA